MCADRRIDADGAIELLGTDDLVVERFSHAVQALEFVAFDREVRTCIGVDAGQRLGIMRGKLREDGVRCVEELFCAGDIAMSVWSLRV